MMKPSGVFSAAEKTENSDAIKRLYRCASDVVRKLDKIQKIATNVEDCYQSSVQTLRTRLREICERLMFLDPIGHGKKAEDLLWRKVHYEAISCAKNFRKNSSWKKSDPYWVSNHIKLGIGTYHHLLFRLQSEFLLNEGYADFLPHCDSRGSVKEKPNRSINSKTVKDNDVTEWALRAFQRCLICMGDLARYYQEFCGGCSSHTAARYYHQALLICSQSSMPHNQLGTLVGNKSYGLDSAYYYMRCVMGSNGFEGARGNLRRVFEKNQQLLQEFSLTSTDPLNEQRLRELHVKSFIVGFIQYCDFCFRYPDVEYDLPVGHLCQMVIEDFRKCLDINLSNVKPLANIANEESHSSGDMKKCCEEEILSHLPDHLILQVFIMSLMCVEKLNAEDATCTSAATALTLAAFSHLLCYILLYLKKNLFGQKNEPCLCLSTTDLDKLPVIGTDVEPILPSVKENSVASDENSQKTNNLTMIAHHKHISKNGSKKPSLRHRRKRPDGIHLDDSDLSEGHASSSSETDHDDNQISDISDAEETEGSSPCTDDDQGDDDDVLEKNVKETNGAVSPNHLSDSNLNLHFDNDVKDLKNEPNSDSKIEDTSVLNDFIPACDVLRSVENSQKSVELINEEDHRRMDATDLKTENLKVEQLNPSTVEQFMLADKLLPVVKLCGDWLMSNPHIITASAQGSQKLWLRYVDLLTLLAIIKSSLNTEDVCSSFLNSCKNWAEEEWQQSWPLPEDVISRGLSSVCDAQKMLRFESRSSVWFTEKEEVLLRLSCLQHLGFMLSKYSELGIKYSADKEHFVFGSEPLLDIAGNNHVIKKKKGKSWMHHNSEGKMQDRKKHLMHNMAQLWLEAEVKELESSVQSTGRPKFTPYLIPDSSVLLDNLHLVRQLMTSKVFIFILPITVLQCLDRMKKESIKAREAIRWLEGEFQKRNRYLRAQKPQERLTLTLLKYPKRKDKEGCASFAILECANYFARQGSASNDLSTNLVTLLTTTNAGSTSASETTTSNLYALAGSAGLKVQNIEELHTNWETATKTQN